jgi:RimJ/RimL family protein N-acetyltransferase
MAVDLGDARMNQDTIDLRPATDQDADFLYSLCGDSRVGAPLALGHHDRAYWQQAIRDWAADLDEEAFIIHSVLRQGRIGWVALNGLRAPDRVVWVKMMAFLPEVWGGGYCRSSMHLIKEQITRRGFGTIRLWTDTSNLRALRCYGASGFVPIGQEIGFVGDPPQERMRTLMEYVVSRPNPQ